MGSAAFFVMDPWRGVALAFAASALNDQAALSAGASADCSSSARKASQT